MGYLFCSYAPCQSVYGNMNFLMLLFQDLPIPRDSYNLNYDTMS